MVRKNLQKNRIFASLMVALLIFTMLPIFAFNAYAADSANKTVRVGYEDSGLFFTLDADGKPVGGYAYDYIETFAEFAGWDVEYIPCDSFEVFLEKMLLGEFDLMYDVSYTPERDAFVLFPDNPMGSEEYYLYYYGGNKSSIYPGDYESMNGARVGVTSGTVQIEYLKDWSRRKGISLEIVEFDAVKDKEEALVSGEIDLDLEISLLVNDDFSSIEKIESSDYYLVINKQRTDLLQDMNDTYTKIMGIDRYFLQHLEEKYYAQSSISKTLFADEAMWVATHDILKVAYLNDYMPFSDTSINGDPVGIVADIVPMLFSNVGLDGDCDIEYIGFDSTEKMYDSLVSGECDVAFPAYGGMNYGNKKGVSFTTDIISAPIDIVFKGNYSEETTNVIAINRNNELQEYFTKTYYPDSAVIYFDSIYECLDAVDLGIANSTILNGLRTDSLINGSNYENLHVQMLSETAEFSFAVSHGSNTLLALVSRAVASTDKNTIFAYASKYTQKEDSVGEFFRKHPEYVWGTMLLLVAIVMIFVLYKRVDIEKRAADAANRSKTSFLFNMSHDIRTPMNAITGFTNMAKIHIDDKEKVMGYLEKIDTSGQQLLSLINQVLEMARIESGKIELEENTVDVRKEYESAVTVLAEQAEEKGLEFHHSLSGITHNYVLADESRMSSITLNIAGNAMKYTPRGGRIDYSLKEIPARKEGYATYVFTVEDTGIGMSEEYLKQLYEPFTRENTSTVSKIQGTGLGMSIVKEIVDLMGGNIEVQSEPNKGTRFDITIDFKLSEEEKIEKDSEAQVDMSILAGHRGLIVDDNELNREIAFEILNEKGIISEDAEDGTKAVELLKEKGPDYYEFILMDLQMPIMDGYTATKTIRAMYPEKHIPIIALSANAFAEDRAASLAAGMDEHVAKPIKAKELFSVLAKLI